jgi:hypothetical protein
MAVGPIGNAIFVNQQTATVASVQGNQNTRFDLQNLAAQAAANEKEEQVMEVRPTEENEMVDADREHQKTKRIKKTNATKKRMKRRRNPKRRG